MKLKHLQTALIGCSCAALAITCGLLTVDIRSNHTDDTSTLERVLAGVSVGSAILAFIVGTFHCCLLCYLQKQVITTCCNAGIELTSLMLIAFVLFVCSCLTLIYPHSPYILTVNWLLSCSFLCFVCFWFCIDFIVGKYSRIHHQAPEPESETASVNINSSINTQSGVLFDVITSHSIQLDNVTFSSTQPTKENQTTST